MTRLCLLLLIQCILSASLAHRKTDVEMEITPRDGHVEIPLHAPGGNLATVWSYHVKMRASHSFQPTLYFGIAKYDQFGNKDFEEVEVMGLQSFAEVHRRMKKRHRTVSDQSLEDVELYDDDSVPPHLKPQIEEKIDMTKPLPRPKSSDMIGRLNDQSMPGSGLPSSNGVNILGSETPKANEPIMPIRAELPQNKPGIVPIKAEIPQNKPAIVPIKTEIPQNKPAIVPIKAEIPQNKPGIVPIKEELPQNKPEIIPIKSEIPPKDVSNTAGNPNITLTDTEKPNMDPNAPVLPSKESKTTTTANQKTENRTTVKVKEIPPITTQKAVVLPGILPTEPPKHDVIDHNIIDNDVIVYDTTTYNLIITIIYHGPEDYTCRVTQFLGNTETELVVSGFPFAMIFGSKSGSYTASLKGFHPVVPFKRIPPPPVRTTKAPVVKEVRKRLPRIQPHHDVIVIEGEEPGRGEWGEPTRYTDDGTSYIPLLVILGLAVLIIVGAYIKSKRKAQKKSEEECLCDEED